MIKNITDKIQTSLIGARYETIGDVDKVLTDIVGSEPYHISSGIADGADEDETEDTEIWYDSFGFEGINLIVRVYYGNVTREINYVDVAEMGV